MHPRNRAHKVAANQIGIESSHTKYVQTPDQSSQFTPKKLAQIKAFFQAGKTAISANYIGNPTPFCSTTTPNFEDT